MAPHYIRQGERLIPDTLKPLAVSIDTLMPYGKNPRNGDLEAIKESLEQNKQYRPIVVNARDNRILAGNHTYAAAMELGWQEIAATFVDVDDDAAARIVLVDNRTNDLAWNDDALIAELLDDLPSLEGTGYTDKALEELLAGIEKAEHGGLTDPDAVPEVPEEPVTKRGDVWLLGRHRVGCGDATVVSHVDRLMLGEEVDIVFTDPPYGIGKDIENDHLEGTDFAEFNHAWTSILPVKPNAHMVFFHSTRTFPSALWAATQAGWDFMRMLWFHRPDKFPVHTWKGWVLTSQAILLFSRGEPRYLKVSPADQDFYRVTSADLGGGHGHPTEKVVSQAECLMAHLGGDVIYEPFCGSGTTLIAAERSGRACYMMELAPQYTDVICRRFQQYTGTLPILESTGEEHDFVNKTSRN